MRIALLISGLLAALASTPQPAGAVTIAAMQGHRRIVLVAATTAEDPDLVAQRSALKAWSRGAAERDVTLVQIVSGHVVGASDRADDLLRRYDVRANRFQTLLIGKDGHVVLRSSHPLSAQNLQAAIDAMPMRRAGQR